MCWHQRLSDILNEPLESCLEVDFHAIAQLSIWSSLHDGFRRAHSTVLLYEIHNAL